MLIAHSPLSLCQQADEWDGVLECSLNKDTLQRVLLYGDRFHPTTSCRRCGCRVNTHTHTHTVAKFKKFKIAGNVDWRDSTFLESVDFKSTIPLPSLDLWILGRCVHFDVSTRPTPSAVVWGLCVQPEGVTCEWARSYRSHTHSDALVITQHTHAAELT